MKKALMVIFVAAMAATASAADMVEAIVVRVCDRIVTRTQYLKRLQDGYTEIETYENGVSRVHVASHRELERRLSAAGLDEGAVAADLAALHHGRVLVLVEAA